MNILKSAARLFGVAFSAASILFVVGAFAITQYPAAVDGALTPVLMWLNGSGQAIPTSAANPLPVSGSVSASISGFTPASVGTPISVTAGGVTGTLPAGTVVVASNAGATNTAYCALGASSTTAQQPIPPGGWFAFTVGAATQLTCITPTSTTTVNMVGGSGLPTGSGGAGGSISNTTFGATQGTSPWVVGGTVTPSNTSAAPLFTAGNESGTAPVQTATPANASHTAGQSVGGLFTIPMLRVAGGGGLLEYISIMSVGGDPAPLQVSVWDREPTNSNFACIDNSAYADGSGSTGGTVGTDQSHMLPGFPQSVTLAVPAQTTGDAKSYGVVTLSPPISVKNQDNTPSVNLYVCLKAASTYTPGGAAYYVNAIGPQD
jgi:hypothetical protein